MLNQTPGPTLLGFDVILVGTILAVVLAAMFGLTARSRRRNKQRLNDLRANSDSD